MHLASGNVPVDRSVLPDGEKGVDITVGKMASIAHGIYGSKSPKIRSLAINIINGAGVKNKDYYGMIVAVHNWVRDTIRYVKDPIGQETLSHPEELAFNTKAGDCDDLSTLEIALLGSIGIPAYPVVIGTAPGRFSHVYIYAEVPNGNHRMAGQVIPLDPIMREWPAGREAPAGRIKAKKVYRHLGNPLNLEGNDMLGAYATGPSYLDSEFSGASVITVPDKGSYTNKDKTVANGVRSNNGMMGIDSMMQDASEMPPTGGYFTEESPGDGGTIVRQNGELIPRGFLRTDPSVREIMHMTPATGKELGPLGPMFARKADSEHSRLQVSDMPKPLMIPVPFNPEARPVPSAIGQKTYELSTVAKTLAAKKLKGYNKTFLKGPKTVNLSAYYRPVQSVITKTLGEELSDAEAEMTALSDALQASIQAPAPTLYAVEQRRRRLADLQARLAESEKKCLELRQLVRDMEMNMPAADEIRAAQVKAAEYAAYIKKHPKANTIMGRGKYLRSMAKAGVHAPTKINVDLSLKEHANAIRRAVAAKNMILAHLQYAKLQQFAESWGKQIQPMSYYGISRPKTTGGGMPLPKTTGGGMPLPPMPKYIQHYGIIPSDPSTVPAGVWAGKNRKLGFPNKSGGPMVVNGLTDASSYVPAALCAAAAFALYMYLKKKG